MKLVAATCSQLHAGNNGLFEPMSVGLPAVLLASPALVQMTRGTVYIPIVNVGVNDVVLYPRTVIGTLSHAHVVSLPTGVTESAEQVTARIFHRQSLTQCKRRLMPNIWLHCQKKISVRSLLQNHSEVFSAHEGDLGCFSIASTLAW